MKPEAQLKILRLRIDQCDHLILKTLHARFKIAKQIGKLKSRLKFPIIQEDRWMEVLKDRLKIAKKLKLSEPFVLKLLKLIHKESIHLQAPSSVNRKRS